VLQFAVCGTRHRQPTLLATSFVISYLLINNNKPSSYASSFFIISFYVSLLLQLLVTFLGHFVVSASTLTCNSLSSPLFNFLTCVFTYLQSAVIMALIILSLASACPFIHVFFLIFYFICPFLQFIHSAFIFSSNSISLFIYKFN